MSMLIRSLADYDGPKADYAPVTDPTTDEAAKFRNRYACDVSMMMHTAPRAIVSFVTGAVSASDPSGFVHDSMWGSLVGVKPVITRSAAGIWDVAWTATVTDDLTLQPAELGGGVTHTVDFRCAYAQATAVAGVLKHAVADTPAANVVRVRTYLANGTVDDITGSTVTVWVY